MLTCFQTSPPSGFRPALAGVFMGMIMAERVVIFVDYQNVYMRARDAFHNPSGNPHWMGQINPTALGRYLVSRAGGSEGERDLHGVRIYRGMPSNGRDPKGYRAARRQIAEWERQPLVTVTTRPFRYPRNYPDARPVEKGIDVQIALDFVMMAVRGEYDVGVLMSNDTDLRPAIEEVIKLGSGSVEVAAWQPRAGRPRQHLRLSGSHRQPYCHWIDLNGYSSVADTTDYAR